MPELPDLSVFVKNLNKTLSGKTLRKINVYRRTNINVSKTTLKIELEENKLMNIYKKKRNPSGPLILRKTETRKTYYIDEYELFAW